MRIRRNLETDDFPTTLTTCSISNGTSFAKPTEHASYSHASLTIPNRNQSILEGHPCGIPYCCFTGKKKEKCSSFINTWSLLSNRLSRCSRYLWKSNGENFGNN